MRLSEASKGFGGLGLAGWIETAWCCGQDRSLALKGRNIREARSRPQASIHHPHHLVFMPSGAA